MFCPKCGEAIPDNSPECPKCGVILSDKSKDQAVFYATQKENLNSVQISIRTSKYVFAAMIALAVCSFIFMGLDYMSIRVNYISSTDYTGYYLIKCLEGTAALSGWMMILLIVTNILTIFTALIGIKGDIIQQEILKKIIIAENLLYIIASVVPLIHLTNLLEDFDTPLSSAGIGVGCYLNIAVALLMSITTVYFCKKASN